MDKMKSIKEVLAGKVFREWDASHQHMEQLQQALAKALAEYEISPDSCCIEGLVNETLSLCAISAAATVRIKQILPTLQGTLNSQGFLVQKIQVRVVKIAD
ncbi:MAG: hypothetical protein K0U15_02690 [Proteobacteria bacterium]|nr:hypothetical protein [Pseudomonadota bacterium]MCH9758329.1 hypothetical protein [Pseudomonadota bacterium]